LTGSFDYIEANLRYVNQRIEKICRDCGRDSSEIKIVAVSKTFPPGAIETALKFNQKDFGENRAQELAAKQLQLRGRDIRWHLVGNLQTNKVKLIVPFVCLIHSVDSLKLAMKINAEAGKINRVADCLIQVNTSNEPQKHGCMPNELLNLARQISAMENIRICGLMTLAKMMSDENNPAERKIVRENFQTLRELFLELRDMNIPGTDFKYLSMGMTSDYDIAIEEGSNMLRIGSAIFGARQM
jgi:pyridoxal phosphate enzyme (YggS family)